MNYQIRKETDMVGLIIQQIGQVMIVHDFKTMHSQYLILKKVI